MSSASTDQLAAALVQTGSPLLFAAAGEVLAQRQVDNGHLTPEMVNLADAMHRRLTQVQWAICEHDHLPLLVSVATAAAVLGHARPGLTERVRHFVATLLGPASPPIWTDDVDVLAQRSLLALVIGDVHAAERAVDVLRQRGHVVGPVLAEWAARQRASGTDANQAWQLLRALSRRLDGPVPATLLVLAAFALPTADAIEWSPVSVVRAEAPSMG